MKTIKRQILLQSCLVLAALGSTTQAQNASTLDKTIEIERAALPARYAAPLPTSLADMQAWLEGNPALAPPGHVIDSILGGDAKWLARLSAAGNAVASTEGTGWARAWDEVLASGTAEPEFCAQVRPIFTGAASVVRAALSGPFSRVCAKPTDLPLIVRADTPNWAVLDFFDPWNLESGASKRRPYHPRLAAAVRETILGSGSVVEARAAAFVLIEQRDRAADTALLAIHAEIKERERADQVAMAFIESASAEGRQRASAACGHVPDDALCRYLNRALAGEADDEEQAPPSTPADPAAVKARVAQLSALGFSKVSGIEVDRQTSSTAESVLLAAGYGYFFDLETDLFPNQHDSLMRTLARLLAPELDGAVFEEVAPKVVESESDEAIDAADMTGPYLLSIYIGGKRYRTQAENLGDWYDAGAVLRLMNAMLEDRKSTSRFAILATRDQNAIIVAAPATAIARAAKEKLLDIAEPGQAERAAIGIERAVPEGK